MQSILLKVAARHLFYLFLIFSVIVLLRGHNQPGGGFIGGLVASTAFILKAITEPQEAKRIRPHLWITIGLFSSLVSGLVPMLFHRPFLAGMWLHIKTAVFGDLHFGTPMLFDIGVYMTVMGVVLLMVYTLFED